MNSKKVLAIAIAGIISTQSMSFAHAANRTAGIGEAQVAVARVSMGDMIARLNQLDKSLVDAKNLIERREDTGDLTAGIAITAAAAGVGLTALAFIDRTDDGGIGLIFMSTIAGTISALSALASDKTMDSQANLVTVERLKNNLLQTENKAKNILLSSTDKSEKLAAQSIISSLENIKEQVDKYQSSENSGEKTRVLAQIGQGVGMAMLVYGIRKEKGLATVGATLLSAAGNVAVLVNAMSDSEAEATVKEINRLRQSIANAKLALK